MRHDDDDNNKDDKQLTSYDIFNLRRKSLYLLKFYETCEEEMPQKTMMQCSNITIKQLQEEGWAI